MKKFVRTACLASCALISAFLAVILLMQAKLPDEYMVAKGDEFFLLNNNISASNIPFSKEIMPVLLSSSGEHYQMNLKLMGTIPIKRVNVQVVDRKMVVPGGCPFGIKMHTKGVLVVGMSNVQQGVENVNPAKDAGLKVGDILTHIGNVKVSEKKDVERVVAACDGCELKFTVIRDGLPMDFYVTPVKSQYGDGYKAGIWVRDSSAGIGTMTYYDPQTLEYCGLGHAICDIDTGEIMPLAKGEIVEVNISGVNIGQSGQPGELKGIFMQDRPVGSLTSNTTSGVSGVLTKPIVENEAIPLAMKQEIQPGSAYILATVSGSKPRRFEIVIEKINYADTTPTKNMVIRVIDPELLALSGGIVQGMSGSPIIQSGRLVGAVTHVFVNDPTRGYGIFSENMEKSLNIHNSCQNVA